jgi:hypothetical protein
MLIGFTAMPSLESSRFGFAAVVVNEALISKPIVWALPWYQVLSARSRRGALDGPAVASIPLKYQNKMYRITVQMGG